MNVMQMMNNPMIKQLMNSNNPRQFALNMIKNSSNANSPIGKNIISMIENNDMRSLESYARNLAESQGVDINQLQNMMKNIR